MYTALLKVLCYSMFSSLSCHAIRRHPAMLSSHAILPCYRRHPAMPSCHAIVAMPIASLSCHAIVAMPIASLSCHAVLPCCPAMLSCHAVLPRDTSPTSHANDINIPLPMLYICFSTNYKPFAMLLPLCGLVLLFCCTFFKASFNSASIAPIAELYR